MLRLQNLSCKSGRNSIAGKVDPRPKHGRSDQCSCYFCWMVGIIIKLWASCWFSVVRLVGIENLSLEGFAYLVRKQGGITVLLTLLCRNFYLYSNCMHGFSFHVACSSVGCYIEKTIVFRVFACLVRKLPLYILKLYGCSHHISAAWSWWVSVVWTDQGARVLIFRH